MSSARSLAVVLGAVAVTAAAPSSARTSRSPGARAAAIRTVSVSWGRIGYRAVGSGSGPPLLLLAGGGTPAPSIDDWPPALIDRLARHRRVLAVDYEGVGRTSARGGTLSITRLADDTADFIQAMHLRRVDVLGWSMGGFVAQSLAIRHAGLVRRLVLAASALGNGTAKPQKVTGQPAYPAQWLFPFGPRNRAQADAFERAVHSYPHYYEGSATVGHAEGLAIFLWLHGNDPEGHQAARIKIAVLVADGSQDVILPSPDSQYLARAVPHAALTLYHDAGHGFLVQHVSDWALRVDRFLLSTERR